MDERNRLTIDGINRSLLDYVSTLLAPKNRIRKKIGDVINEALAREVLRMFAESKLGIKFPFEIKESTVRDICTEVGHEEWL